MCLFIKYISISIYILNLNLNIRLSNTFFHLEIMISDFWNLYWFLISEIDNVKWGIDQNVYCEVKENASPKVSCHDMLARQKTEFLDILLICTLNLSLLIISLLLFLWRVGNWLFLGWLNYWSKKKNSISIDCFVTF